MVERYKDTVAAQSQNPADRAGSLAPDILFAPGTAVLRSYRRLGF